MKHYCFLIGLLVVLLQPLSAQRRIPFNGVLMNLNGTPIKGAHVYVKSAKDYSLTNKEGQFGLTNVMPNDTLKILVKKKLYTLPIANRKSLIIRLGDEKNIQSNEDQGLIDMGFSFVPRRERTIPGNFISGEELRRSGANDVLSALQGRVPGLDIMGSGFGVEKEVTMRGTKSFSANSMPLLIIDDVKVPNFEGVNLNDVEYVEIMKEASAYGSEGANGAIIVHTKMVEK